MELCTSHLIFHPYGTSCPECARRREIQSMLQEEQRKIEQTWEFKKAVEEMRKNDEKWEIRSDTSMGLGMCWWAILFLTLFAKPVWANTSFWVCYFLLGLLNFGYLCYSSNKY